MPPEGVSDLGGEGGGGKHTLTMKQEEGEGGPSQEDWGRALSVPGPSVFGLAGLGGVQAGQSLHSPVSIPAYAGLAAWRRAEELTRRLFPLLFGSGL